MPAEATTASLEARAREHGFSNVLQPGTREELVEIVRGLAADQEPFLPLGGGSSLGRGAPSGATTAVSLAALSGVTRFAPDDLTCGVAAGTTLEELDATLQPAGLELAPGPFAASRTVGGVFGEAPPSSRGFDRAAPRSQLIGVTAVDGQGRTFRAGGNVVKNVAGYDLCKLFVGSGGAFFTAVELQLRLVPVPETTSWLASEWLPRDRAGVLWLRLRRRCIDARAIDCVFRSDGAARVEMLLAGPAELVQALEKQAELAPCETPQPVAGATLRGTAPPTAVADLASRLPDGCNGRVHLQGAFALTDPHPDAFPQGTVVPALGRAAPSRGSTIVERLKRTFGVHVAPRRASFDTVLEA